LPADTNYMEHYQRSTYHIDASCSYDQGDDDDDDVDDDYDDNADDDNGSPFHEIYAAHPSQNKTIRKPHTNYFDESYDDDKADDDYGDNDNNEDDDGDDDDDDDDDDGIKMTMTTIVDMVALTRAGPLEDACM